MGRIRTRNFAVLALPKYFCFETLHKQGFFSWQFLAYFINQSVVQQIWTDLNQVYQ